MCADKFLLLIVLASAQVLLVGSQCIEEDYLQLEQSLLKRPHNLENLSHAFFPINRQASISVNVTYNFNNTDSSLQYRWIDSSVNMFIHSDLLKYFSLFLYNVETRQAYITLDPFCHSDTTYDVDDIKVELEPTGSCFCNDTAFLLLNELTTNLQSYAIHRNSVRMNGIDRSSEGGYSVFVFHSSNPNDYCVLNDIQDFNRFRYLLYMAFGILELASAFVIPLLMANVYRRFKGKMEGYTSTWLTEEQRYERKSTVMPFFVWAFALISGLLILGMYACNGLALSNSWKPNTKFQEVYIGFIFLIVGLILLPILDIIAAFCVLIRFNYLVNTDPPRNFCDACSQIDCVTAFQYSQIAENNPADQENEEDSPVARACVSCTYCAKSSFHFFSIVSFTLLAQLTLFHLIFLSLAAVAAPVETGSLVLLSIASLFCLVSFFALALKMFFVSLGERCKFQDNCISTRWGCFFYLFLLIVFAIVLAAGVAVFVAFIYYYTMHVQEYRNNRGILAFLGALWPSVLAVSTGVFLKMLLPCLETRRRVAADDQEDQH